MKKILVMSGGTGPTALLQGLHETGVMKFAKVQMLINCLDNGMSSLSVRQVFNGKLLGPSDSRKNAMRRHVQIHGKTALYKMLDERFDAPSSEAKQYVINKILDLKLEYKKELLLCDATNEYFKQPHASTIIYSDFSVANLIYGGVASLNGLSLLKATKIINKELLEIEEDFVILNSDESVFINAVTESGHVLTDEVDINGWNDAEDRVASIFFTDPSGKKVPAPNLHPEAAQAIKDADIIIYSTGTQWTSLIPTYATCRFREALAESNAKQYLIMNNRSDTDMTGLSSADIMDILANYLPMEDITTILNSEAQPHMKVPAVAITADGDEVAAFPTIILKLSTEADVKRGWYHTGRLLVNAILCEHFVEEIVALEMGAELLLDYDDTLVGRNGSFKDESAFNKKALKALSEDNNISIVSGNSIRNIDKFYPGLRVFADNACNCYSTVVAPRKDNDFRVETLRYKLERSDDKSLLTQLEVDGIISIIAECGIDISKITNRAYAGICIKPVAEEYRFAIAKLARMMLSFNYEVKVSGRTTIDIYKKGVSKMNIVNEFHNAVYVGDEWKSGNDADVYQASLTEDSGITFVKVNDPADTALFFTALLASKEA